VAAVVEEVSAVAAAAVVGAVTSSTGNGVPAEVSVAAAVVAAVVPRRDDRRTNLAAVVGRCGVQQRPVTWPHTRAVPQSTANAIVTVRAAGPDRSYLPPTPSTWPPRWRIP